MSDRTAQARAEAERQTIPTSENYDYLDLREFFMEGVEWADANPQPLPRPGDGCQCTGYSQDAGGGHFEYLVEYEPACPEHSEHVYNPRTGVWEHANPEPHTITRGGYEHAKRMFGISPAETRQFLRALGIEAEYDDE